MKLEQHITQLKHAVEVVHDSTADDLRQRECKDLLQAIAFAESRYNRGGDFRDLDEILDRTAKQVNFLVENPNHAGRHEELRKNLTN